MRIWFHRLFLAGIVLAILTGSLPARAAESPAEFVAAFLDEAFGLFRAEAITAEQRRAALRDLFTRKMDMPHMARFMTMDQVVEAKPDRQQRFEGLLAGYLVETFYPKIAEGASASVDVAKSSQSRTPDNPAVDSIIRKSGSPPEPITWHLRPAGGSYKIVDVISEGMSLATTYRDVFGAVMLSGGFQRLEQMLTAKQ
jgi:phospholipid transport system substrate-binding protein